MCILMLIILFFSLSWIFEMNYSVSKNLISPFCYLVQNDFRISKCAGLHLIPWAWSIMVISFWALYMSLTAVPSFCQRQFLMVILYLIVFSDFLMLHSSAVRLVLD